MTPGQLGVPLRHFDVRVAQDLGQLVKISAVHHVPRGEGVPQIVEAETLDTGQLQDGFKTLPPFGVPAWPPVPVGRSDPPPGSPDIA